MILTDNLLKSRAGKAETVRVLFRKTVNTGQYETEIFEADTSVDVPEGITGIERNIIVSILFAELEYGVLLKLVARNKITKQDMDETVTRTEMGIKFLYDKAKELGITPEVEKYINGTRW